MRFLAWPTIGLSLLLAGLAPAAEVPPPSGETIVPAGAKLELLYTRAQDFQGGLSEGPAVAPDGSIYFTDISLGDAKSYILRFDPKSKKTTVFTDTSGKANGLQFDAEGRLVACEGSDFGGRCVSRWDVKTGKKTVLADRYQGKKFNAPNDLVIDRQGRIYFSDPRYLGDEPRELEHRAVYRIEADGAVTEITREVEKPNGIALSPDGKTLYLADHNNGADKIDPAAPKPTPGAMKIYAFPLGPDGRVAGPRRTLVDLGARSGCDGMCVDEQGHVYLTIRSVEEPGVWVIHPEGKRIAFIPTGPAQPDAKAPIGLPSNVTFGAGDEAQVLYITVDVSLYRIPLKVKGLPEPWAPKK